MSVTAVFWGLVVGAVVTAIVVLMFLAFRELEDAFRQSNGEDV